MLASIQVLRMNTREEESGRGGAETPLPALELLEQNDEPSGNTAFDIPSPQLRPYDWRVSVDDGYESADSMPGLRSVYDLSDDQSSDGDENSSRRAMRLGDRVLTSTHAAERIQSIEQFSGRRVDRAEEPMEGGEDGEVDSTSDTPVPTEEPRSEPPFVTDGRGRVVWTSPAEEDKTTEEPNGEPAGRPEVAGGSGGLLGWFNALF